MTLVPCESCRRHVRDRDRACPFCAVARTPKAVAVRVFAGRYSRAVAFAGLAACYTGSGQQASTPPPDRAQRTMKPTPQALYGRLTDDRTGAPLAGVVIELWIHSNIPLTATTDANGDYLLEAPAGEYTVSFRGPDGTQYSTSKILTVEGRAQRLDIPINRTPMPIPAPYGAPPARRRTV